MLFNSLEYLLFLPIVFCLYWVVFQKNLKIQNLLLLISRYVFYGWWDWRFLSLIFLSTLVDYFVGLKIHGSGDKNAENIIIHEDLLPRKEGGKYSSQLRLTIIAKNLISKNIPPKSIPQ